MKKYFQLFFLLSFTLVSLSDRAQYSILHSFNDTDGSAPSGDVILSGKTLFGMARYGGVYNKGVIFSIDTLGSNYKTLLDFDSLNGANPCASLVQCNNKLYGMTSGGGTNNNGVLFSIDTSGNNYSVLLKFNGANGACPYGSLIASGGILFGMTFEGGAFSNGCIFHIDTNGNNYKRILSFNGINGGSPFFGALTLSGNVLYGMSSEGGFGYGIIFAIDTDGTRYRGIYNFNDGSGSGSVPYGSLTLSGSKLYGMTPNGGTVSGPGGCIFVVDTDGTGYRDLLDCQGGITGSSPFGSLTLSENRLYGMMYAGKEGVFVIDTSGNGFRHLYDFTDISYPYGDLTISNRVLYGMTSAGGAYLNGKIFKIDTASVAGINKVNTKETEVTIYPNPSNGIFHLQINNYRFLNNTFIEIYNMLGEKIKKGELKNRNTALNLSKYPSGIYLYRVIGKTGKLLGEGKIIKQ